jgi:hypothetical protein
MQRALQGILFCTVALLAQGPGSPQAAQPAQTQTAAGLETPWEIAPVLLAMSDHSMRLLAVLDRFDANTWLEKGASPTYAEQLQSCKEQVKAVADTARTLSRNPEQLAASLELLIRMQSLDTMLASLEEVIRKYQDPARAQDLVGLEAENGANRDRFQQYLVSLAADREHALQVMDKEAQRCRSLLALPASAPSKTGKKK